MQEEQLWLTTVSSASATCLLVLTSWSLRVWGSTSTIYSWFHTWRGAFPLLWRSVLKKRQLRKQRQNTSFGVIFILKLDWVLSCREQSAGQAAAILDNEIPHTFSNRASSILKSGFLPACVHCAKLPLSLLIYSPDFLSAHSYPWAPVLVFSLFSLLFSCHWRSVKSTVKGCPHSPCK